VFEAMVTRVSDGDTFWVRRAGGMGSPPFKVRLQGIDAPERCQPGGADASHALTRRVLHQRVLLQPVGRDEHERLLARVRHDGEDLGAWLVVSGLAWSDGRGRSAGPYRDEQGAAQRERRGVHADPVAVRPRDFRRRFGPCP
jgi:micrococcal nuclease